MKPSLKAQPTDGTLPPRASRFAFLRTLFSKVAFVAFVILASAVLRFWAEGSASSFRNEAAPTNPPTKVSINQADQATLESLPGIGPVLAKRMIEDRKRNGLYHRPEDLLRVSGLGQVRVDGMMADIHFDPPPPQK